MKKKISGGKIALIVILSIIAAIIVACVSFVLIVKMRMDTQVLRVDDIEAVINAKPMSFEERLAFHEDGTMDFAVNKGDIYYVLNKMYDDDFEGYISGILNDYGFNYDEIGFVITEDGIEADLGAHWKSFRIAGTMYLDVRFASDVVIAQPKKIKLAGFTIDIENIASLIRVPVGRMQIDYEPETSLMSEIKAVNTVQDKMIFSGPMETANVRSVNLLTDDRLDIMRVTQESCNLISPVLSHLSDNPKTCYWTLLPRLIEDPSLYTDFIHQLYGVLNEPRACNFVHPENNYGLSSRYFENISAMDLEALRLKIYDEYYVAYRMFPGFIHKVYLSDVDYDAPFDAKAIFGDEYITYSNVFDLDSAFFARTGTDESAGHVIILMGKDGFGHAIFNQTAIDNLTEEQFNSIKETGIYTR